MEKMTLSYPDNFEQAIHITKNEFEYEIRLMAALKMFELGKLSSGKAAELAGISRVEFFETCGRYQVSVFNYPADQAVEEIEADIATLKSLGQ